MFTSIPHAIKIGDFFAGIAEKAYEEKPESVIEISRLLQPSSLEAKMKIILDVECLTVEQIQAFVEQMNKAEYWRKQTPEDMIESVRQGWLENVETVKKMCARAKRYLQEGAEEAKIECRHELEASMQALENTVNYAEFRTAIVKEVRKECRSPERITWNEVKYAIAGRLQYPFNYSDFRRKEFGILRNSLLPLVASCTKADRTDFCPADKAFIQAYCKVLDKVNELHEKIIVDAETDALYFSLDTAN